jgi:hypothetical protein
VTSARTQGGIPITRNKLTRIACTAAALAALGAVAPAAQAATTATTSAVCGHTLSTIFSAFGDSGYYTLVPNGHFEAGTTGWTLGAARVVTDQAGFKLGGIAGRKSLELPAGAKVTSAPVCAAKTYKTFRFVARSVAGQASLDVEVLYADGRVKSAGTLKPTNGWAPTPVLQISQGALDLAATGTTMVKFRFTARSAAVRIDDVYIDPRYRA